MSSRRNRRDHQIRYKQMEMPNGPCKHILNDLTIHKELCLQRNLHIRAFRTQTQLNVISNLLSRGEAISQEMSLKATTFQFMQRWPCSSK